MLQKTQNFAPFDPEWWYNERKMNKTNLPYVFSVVSCRTQIGKLSLFIFLTLYHHLGSKGTQFCVLWSISTYHLNQAECGRYKWITRRAWHHDASNSSDGLPVVQSRKKNPMQRTMSLKLNLTSWSICFSDCLLTTDRHIFSVFRINWEIL